MLSHEEALEAAREFLDRKFAAEPYTIVLQPELTREHAVAWAVRFDSREHLDTGNRALAPFMRLVIVPKDGDVPYFPPSHWSTEELDERLAGTQPPTGA